ncbi:hypothetical protein [Mycoplasma sp. 1654_15]|uniref:hypothetical protein n=1 Tax=Mycoplasma sp. 1654_15 TaxID=2725994 RepID=UPI001449354E|nr:hypothetical protein [Mycoplasma sp. 1654_15]QJB71374.1 hypothetical protein HF996_02755 [Mycoplasma sp. 1654_15]
MKKKLVIKIILGITIASAIVVAVLGGTGAWYGYKTAVEKKATLEIQSFTYDKQGNQAVIFNIPKVMKSSKKYTAIFEVDKNQTIEEVSLVPTNNQLILSKDTKYSKLREIINDKNRVVWTDKAKTIVFSVPKYDEDQHIISLDPAFSAHKSIEVELDDGKGKSKKINLRTDSKGQAKIEVSDLDDFKLIKSISQKTQNNELLPINIDNLEIQDKNKLTSSLTPIVEHSDPDVQIKINKISLDLNKKPVRLVLISDDQKPFISEVQQLDVLKKIFTFSFKDLPDNHKYRISKIIIDGDDIERAKSVVNLAIPKNKYIFEINESLNKNTSNTSEKEDNLEVNNDAKLVSLSTSDVVYLGDIASTPITSDTFDIVLNITNKENLLGKIAKLVLVSNNKEEITATTKITSENLRFHFADLITNRQYSFSSFNVFDQNQTPVLDDLYKVHYSLRKIRPKVLSSGVEILFDDSVAKGITANSAILNFELFTKDQSLSNGQEISLELSYYDKDQEFKKNKYFTKIEEKEGKFEATFDFNDLLNYTKYTIDNIAFTKIPPQTIDKKNTQVFFNRNNNDIKFFTTKEGNLDIKYSSQKLFDQNNKIYYKVNVQLPYVSKNMENKSLQVWYKNDKDVYLKTQELKIIEGITSYSFDIKNIDANQQYDLEQIAIIDPKDNSIYKSVESAPSTVNDSLSTYKEFTNFKINSVSLTEIKAQMELLDDYNVFEVDEKFKIYYKPASAKNNNNSLLTSIATLTNNGSDNKKILDFSLQNLKVNKNYKIAKITRLLSKSLNNQSTTPIKSQLQLAQTDRIVEEDVDFQQETLSSNFAIKFEVKEATQLIPATAEFKMTTKNNLTIFDVNKVRFIYTSDAGETKVANGKNNNSITYDPKTSKFQSTIKSLSDKGGRYTLKFVEYEDNNLVSRVNVNPSVSSFYVYTFKYLTARINSNLNKINKVYTARLANKKRFENILPTEDKKLIKDSLRVVPDSINQEKGTLQLEYTITYWGQQQKHTLEITGLNKVILDTALDDNWVAKATDTSEYLWKPYSPFYTIAQATYNKSKDYWYSDKKPWNIEFELQAQRQAVFVKDFAFSAFNNPDYTNVNNLTKYFKVEIIYYKNGTERAEQLEVQQPENHKDQKNNYWVWKFSFVEGINIKKIRITFLKDLQPKWVSLYRFYINSAYFRIPPEWILDDGSKANFVRGKNVGWKEGEVNNVPTNSGLLSKPEKWDIQPSSGIQKLN